MDFKQPSSARLIDVHDFPIGLIDSELSTPPAELVGDTAVVLPRPEQGPPAAVLKVVRGRLRAAELRTQRRVLGELAIHHGLDEEWRELLPRILAFDERTNATMSVESYRPGTDLAEVLARRRAGRVLGWKPDIDLTEGTKRTVDWLRGILDPQPIWS